ncbi:MAG: hypothetical protein QNJ70_09230 [Xenococcaceae cyanobacterium MO_207.B15]|nr:hypothetical protein [Xenococcaceae cyanobacterium MO_207.B15]
MPSIFLFCEELWIDGLTPNLTLTLKKLCRWQPFSNFDVRAQ